MTDVARFDDWLSSVRGWPLEDSKGSHPFGLYRWICAKCGADPNPLVPFPKGEGEIRKGLAPSYPPHPLSQGKGGTEHGLRASIRFSCDSRGSSTHLAGRNRLGRGTVPMEAAKT